MNGKSYLAGLCAAAVLVTAAFPALASDKPKKQRQYNEPYAWWQVDSRQLQPKGTPHTCGHVGFQYDSRGVPMGPYCH